MTAQTTSSDVRHQLFIDGDFVDASAGGTFATRNPATGAVIAEVAEAGPADVEAAVDAARAALDGAWGAAGHDERANILRRIAAAIRERASSLGSLESLDTGQPAKDTPSAMVEAAAWFDHFAAVATTLRSAVIPAVPGYLNYTLYQRIGVVGLIVPWNFPLPNVAVKLPAALAMGNVVLLKPAEQSPLTALALAEIAADAGLPPGVLNVLPGFGPTTGRAIVDHPQVRMVSFTGSTSVGREIAASAGRQLKKVSLELGGKSPTIVFADTDQAVAAEVALFSFAFNQGQVCSAGSRLLVDQAIHEEFLELLTARAERTRVGDPLDPATELGAVIGEDQLARIEAYVSQGREEGATAVAGGARCTVEGLEGGTFFRPTILRDVRPEMSVAREEIFGPVLSVMPFEDERDAVRLANDVAYGLSASVFTNDVSRAHRLAAEIEAGLVYVNSYGILSPGSPYSGWKSSGLGTEGGKEQAHEFSRLKSVWVRTDGEVPTL